MRKLNNRCVIEDSGLILGVVLIALTIVGTVLGSVLMMSQISMESKGQSLTSLKSKNASARIAAQNLEDLITVEEVATDLKNSQNSTNCGVPSDFEGTHIVCTVENGPTSEIKQVKIQFTEHSGKQHQQTFTVPTNGDSNSD